MKNKIIVQNLILWDTTSLKKDLVLNKDLQVNNDFIPDNDEKCYMPTSAEISLSFKGIANELNTALSFVEKASLMDDYIYYSLRVQWLWDRLYLLSIIQNISESDFNLHIKKPIPIKERLWKFLDEVEIYSYEFRRELLFFKGKDCLFKFEQDIHSNRYNRYFISYSLNIKSVFENEYELRLRSEYEFPSFGISGNIFYVDEVNELLKAEFELHLKLEVDLNIPQKFRTEDRSFQSKTGNPKFITITDTNEYYDTIDLMYNYTFDTKSFNSVFEMIVDHNLKVLTNSIKNIPFILKIK